MDMPEDPEELKVSAPLTDISVAYSELPGGDKLADLMFPRVSAAQLTPAQRLTRQDEEDQRNRMLQLVTDSLVRFLQSLGADPVVTAVLRHHAPQVSYGRVFCTGCDDGGGYESESPDWPCSTIRLIAKELKR